MAGNEHDKGDAVPDGRDETEAERLDRNWNALLQELRVLETGTQILTGFLLTVAFQQTFSKLDRTEVVTYLITVSLAALATVLVLAPVPLHRGLFRQHRMDVLVHWTDRILRVALAVAGLAIVGVSVLVFHVAAGATAGLLAGGVTFVVTAALWLVLPALLRRD
jgi:hypothetical protein